MEIMRHSDIKLTTKTYTDTGLLPVSDAVFNLPSLFTSHTANTQIDPQDLFRAGHDQSKPDSKSNQNDLLEPTGIKRVKMEKSGLVLTGQEMAESCRARTRT